MQPLIHSETAPFAAKYFPLHLALLSVGENVMPMGFWTVISKEPFRFIIAMGVGNYSLGLLREHGEAALHFMPWDERERVVRAGWLSGRDVNKAERLGLKLTAAEKLDQTRLVEGADTVFEMVVLQELDGLSREYVPFVMDVVAVHGQSHREPILFMNRKDYATLGERWRFSK
ncbi:MAG: flavin reductase [Candidatus Promineifilaceae bacterium]|nr:flavin reductase [Candidatus Promineifilaceae bacterium]